MTRTTVDHSFLSPCGRISKRARAAEMDRVFGGANLITSGDLYRQRLAAIQPTEIVRLQRDAARLRQLAAGGMKPRAFTKAADLLDAQIAALQAAPTTKDTPA